MNILVISKYPPIEGGVSSQTYWLAKAPAGKVPEKGLNISSFHELISPQ